MIAGSAKDTQYTAAALSVHRLGISLWITVDNPWTTLTRPVPPARLSTAAAPVSRTHPHVAHRPARL